MKVVELIKTLNEIGYDENTELTFGFVNRETVTGMRLRSMKSTMESI